MIGGAGGPGSGNFRLDGRVYLVTGASGGIGRSVCHALADAGASVVAVDIDPAGLDDLRTSLPRPDRHLCLAADLSEITSHDDLVWRAVDGLGRLDGLVSLAAVIRRRALEQITEADWDAQLEINLKATFFLNLAVARHLKTAGGGAITNFTSQAWWSGGLDGSVVYAASKAGVVAVSRGLARELAPYGIRVNTIAPGLVDTPMMQTGMTDARRRAFVESIPLGRMAEPDELAGVVVFLASDAARYITGASISVSGGQFLY